MGSPFKKQRSSLPGIDSEVRRKLALESVGNGGPRRESESAIGSATVAASALGSGGGGDKFEPGPALGSGLGQAVKGPEEMEDEEL